MTCTIHPLLETPIVAVWDVVRDGGGEHPADAPWHARVHLVFPYRGLWVRHEGEALAVAEPGQVLLSNAGARYRTHHPLDGGDACLVVRVHETMLREVAPPELLRHATPAPARDGAAPHGDEPAPASRDPAPDIDRDDGTPGDTRREPPFAFEPLRLRIDARAQALVAMLRHSLHEGVAEPLEAESLALTLVTRALGPRTAHVAGSTAGRQRLVDRTKLVLASDLSRRWTLAEIAAEVGVSPVYLTQAFAQVEALPLYRYQVRLRLARALDRIGDVDDLARLGLEVGFSSHSHFTAAFQQAYGRTPSEFRDAVIARRRRARAR